MEIKTKDDVKKFLGTTKEDPEVKVSEKDIKEPVKTAELKEDPEQKRKALKDDILAEIEKAETGEETKKIMARVNKAIKDDQLKVNDASILTSFISGKSREIQQRINDQKKRKKEASGIKKPSELLEEGDPLSSVVKAGIKIRKSDFSPTTGKVREEFDQLRKKLGPKAFKKDGLTLDEHASQMGISEEELRQRSRSEYKTKESKKDIDRQEEEYRANELRKLQDRPKGKLTSETIPTPVTPPKTVKDFDTPTPEQISKVAVEAAKQPTEAQKEAGNYKKGHVKINDFDITIENAKGSIRSGKDRSGKEWKVTMPAHYGYIKRTKGADSENVDVYIGDAQSDKVFIVDQVDAESGKFDEHKAIMGVKSLEDARSLYVKGFSDKKGQQRLGEISELSVQSFKDWLDSEDLKKPYKFEKETKEVKVDAKQAETQTKTRGNQTGRNRRDCAVGGCE